MNERRPYQNQLAHAFRQPDAPFLLTRTLRKSMVAATELKCDHPDFGLTAPMPRENAYLVALQLRDCHDHDLYFDGRLTRPMNYKAGVTSIYDLRREPVAEIRDPFHCLMFHIPCETLAVVSDAVRSAKMSELRHQPGVSLDDPVVRNLLSALLPALSTPEEAHSLFLDSIALALTAHVVSRYGDTNRLPNLPRSGLAPWQERRAKELIDANLREDISLARMAEECGLSVRHFARAFRQSTGVPPHRWLLKRRVSRARELMNNRNLSLSDIAFSCGFVDQSHFTRVFTALAGVSPGAYRRATLGSHSSNETDPGLMYSRPY